MQAKPGDFVVDYAKTGRAECKKCKKNIGVNTVRMGKVIRSPYHDGVITFWYHLRCVPSVPESPHQILKFRNLKSVDISRVQKRVLGKDATNEDNMEISQEGTENTSNKRKREDGSEDSISGSKKPRNIMEQIKEESDYYWNIREFIESSCDDAIVSKILQMNRAESLVRKGVSAPQRAEALVELVAFGIYYCPQCSSGKLITNDGFTYACDGYMSAFSSCNFSCTHSELPEHRSIELPNPDEESEETKGILEILQSFAMNKHQRIPVASSQPPAKMKDGNATKDAKSEDAAKSGSSESQSNGGSSTQEDNTNSKIFLGLVFSSVGRMGLTAKNLQSIIEKHGGSYVSSISESVTHVISTEESMAKISSAKVADVIDRMLPVLHLDFLMESVSSKSLAVYSKHLICGSLAGDRKKKLVLSNGLELDPVYISDRGNAARILFRDGIALSVSLTRVDIVRDRNSFYLLQLIQPLEKGNIDYFKRWGRIGSKKQGGYSIVTSPNEDEIYIEFKEEFFKKTGNKWEDFVQEKFEKKPNMFYPTSPCIKIEDIPQLNLSTSSEELPPSVLDLLKLIWDTDAINQTLLELEVDITKLPLGRISHFAIKEAYRVLGEIEVVLDHPEYVHKRDQFEAKILDLTNTFYTLVPTSGNLKAKIIDTKQEWKNKLELLDSLTELNRTIEVMMLESTTPKHGNGLQDAYKRLDCNIAPLDQSEKIYKIIEKYVKNSKGPTHNLYKLSIQDIYQIERNEEKERQSPVSENKQLLWHGTRLMNYVGILTKGLKIAPPEAPSTGYMFGKGIYFADSVTKSGNYCKIKKDNPVGLLLLSEVALGNMMNLKEASFINRLPDEYHSVKGLGKRSPSLSGQANIDGVTIPCGKLVDSKIKNTELEYNEYIVYDPLQVRLRYLVKVKFDFVV